MHVIILYLKTVVFEQKGAGWLEHKPEMLHLIKTSYKILAGRWGPKGKYYI